MEYKPRLDGLRFVAIFLVLLEHFAYYVGSKISAGYYGVDLFFVISGFLITGILFRFKGSFGTAYRTFFFRRTLRIFPIYYLALFILYITQNEEVRASFGYLVTYSYNWAFSHGRASAKTFLFPIWSLCVEEQFYLFWPLLVLGLARRKPLFKAVLAFIIIACGLQLYLSPFSLGIQGNYTGLFPRAYSLGIGALGAVLVRENRINTRLLLNRWVEGCIIFLLVVSLIFRTDESLLFYPFASLFFVLKATYKGFAFQGINRFLSQPAVVHIGAISYGVYLFHPAMAYYFDKLVFDRFWAEIPFENFGILRKLEFHSYIVKFFLYSGLVIFVAHVSHRYFERPILLLKDKWFPYEKEKIVGNVSSLKLVRKPEKV